VEQTVQTEARIEISGGVVALVVVLACSLVFNVLLSSRLRSGKSRSESQTAQRSQDLRLAIGKALPPLPVQDLQGHKQVVQYDTGAPVVLYVFAPSCGWCNRNAPNIAALARAKSSAFRFIGLSLTSRDASTFVRQHGMDFPVYVTTDQAVFTSLGLGSTPQTLVVSSAGRVMKNWVGAYDGELRSEIETFFGMGLPGLTIARRP